MKFKPKNYQLYWYIDGEINHLNLNVQCDWWDTEVEIGFYNCFRTKKEATKALKKIERILQ